MPTSESKGRFFLQNESIRIDSHNESNRIDSNRELECSAVQASRLCTVRQARIQLATVLSLAVLYNAPKFAEARIEVEVDPADNSTWLMPHHTALGLSRLYNVVYGNVCYTLFLRSRRGWPRTLSRRSLPGTQRAAQAVLGVYLYL